MARKKLVTARDLVIFAWVAGGLSLVGAVITALVVVLSAPQAPVHRLPTANPFKETVADSIPQNLNLGDFLFPGPQGDWQSRQQIFSREPRNAWEKDEVERFWIDPKDRDFMKIPEKNDRAILDLLKDFP